MNKELIDDLAGYGAPVILFSGGEPLAQPAFLTALLRLCGRRGIHTVLDTSGHALPETFNQTSGLADAVLFDLKLMDAVFARWPGPAP